MSGEYALKRAPLADLAAYVGPGDEVTLGWDDMSDAERLQALHDAHVWPVLDHEGNYVTDPDTGEVLYQCDYVRNSERKRRARSPDPTPGTVIAEGWDYDERPAENRFERMPATIRPRVLQTTAYRDRSGLSLRVRAIAEVPGAAITLPARERLTSLTAEERDRVRVWLAERVADETDAVERFRTPLYTIDEDPDASGWIVEGDEHPPMRFQGPRG